MLYPQWVHPATACFTIFRIISYPCLRTPAFTQRRKSSAEYSVAGQRLKTLAWDRDLLRYTPSTVVLDTWICHDAYIDGYFKRWRGDGTICSVKCSWSQHAFCMCLAVNPHQITLQDIWQVRVPAFMSDLSQAWYDITLAAIIPRLTIILIHFLNVIISCPVCKDIVNTSHCISISNTRIR